MSRVDVYNTLTCSTNTWQGGGTNYVVQANNGDLYMVYVDAQSDVVFIKSTNDGFTWSLPTVVLTGTARAVSVWYDRWSGIAAGLIHIAYTDDADSDTKYRTINTESSDALSTQTVIFAGSSSAGGGSLSITRARGGNVYCRTTIDAGAEGGFFRLPNANVPEGAWDAARANPEALATTDQMFLAPGFAADTQDILGIFVDASANGLSRYIYDDSANTWAESAIIADGSFTDQVASSAFPHVAVAVDLTNSQLIIVAWTAVDTANADLRCFTVTESAITETATNVVLNSTDDQGLCAIGLNTSTTDWYVFYGGKSDGSDTFLTSINIYYKVSTDDGATWGSETLLSVLARNSQWLVCAPRFTDDFAVCWFNDSINDNSIYSALQPAGAGAGGSLVVGGNAVVH